MVDEFIILDDVQYTRRDWRNRNIIKTRHGLKWLTIPVEVKGRYNQTIRETKVINKKWAIRHWETIKLNYVAAPFYKDYAVKIEEAYIYVKEFEFLSEINLFFIRLINFFLGITTEISSSADYNLIIEGNKTERLINISKQAGATIYLTGPSATRYINTKLFEIEGIKLQWMNYTDYPVYKQLFSSFEHNVSILDLLFNTGPDAKLYLKSF